MNTDDENSIDDRRTFDNIDNLLDIVLPLSLRLLFIPLLTAFTHSTYRISLFLQLLLAMDSLLWLKTFGSENYLVVLGLSYSTTSGQEKHG
jgi:hypothetical protein